MQNKPKYIDLFAGCGGLSLGLEKAGFELELAVEKSDMAAETFYHNFIERISNIEDWKKFSSVETDVLEQAEKKLVVKELSKVLECPELINTLRSKNIDLIAGGPPCQGFSLAGRRNPEDKRNELPWQFLELVEKIEPKAVIIENVSGMAQHFKKHNKKSPFVQLQTALTETGIGYVVQPLLLNAMHFGAPQHRPRVLLIGIRSDLAKNLKIQSNPNIWKSEYDQIGNLNFAKRPDLAPQATHFGSDILTVADAIGDLNKKGYRRLSNIPTFADEMRSDNDWMTDKIIANSGKKTLQNHRLRTHAEHIEMRFRLYQYLRDNNISSKILSIPKLKDTPKAGQIQMLCDALQGAKLPAIAPDGLIIANNSNELIELVMSLGTKKHSQRPLKWNSPSPTVVSLPDDYVHPEEPRTLTVREMARFQSFPDSFEFRAKETTGSLRRRVEVPQYTQVGNAVPPKLGYAVGQLVHQVLTKSIALQNKAQKEQRKAG